MIRLGLYSRSLVQLFIFLILYDRNIAFFNFYKISRELQNPNIIGQTSREEFNIGDIDHLIQSFDKQGIVLSDFRVVDETTHI